MEPNIQDGFELELDINIEELEQKIAPGDTSFPFPGPDDPYGGRGGGGGGGGNGGGGGGGNGGGKP